MGVIISAISGGEVLAAGLDADDVMEIEVDGVSRFVKLSSLITALQTIDPITGADLDPLTVHEPFVVQDAGDATIFIVDETGGVHNAILDGDPLARVVYTSARSVADAVTTNTDATVTSASASFVAGDVGSYIVGVGIPDGTVIASINSATSIEMSQTATATATDVLISITEPDPGAVGAGAVWLQTYKVLDAGFASDAYSLQLRDAGDAFWYYPEIVSTDLAGRVQGRIEAAGSPITIIGFAPGPAGVRASAVSANTVSAFLDAYDAAGADVTGEVVAGNADVYLRATGPGGAQEIRLDNTGIILGQTGHLVAAMGATPYGQDAYIDPTTITPEQLANYQIARGFMAAA